MDVVILSCARTTGVGFLRDERREPPALLVQIPRDVDVRLRARGRERQQGVLG